jgi:hypothetical protein
MLILFVYDPNQKSPVIRKKFEDESFIKPFDVYFQISRSRVG